MKANIVKKISRRDKVLLRPNRFIGSVEPYTTERYIFDNEKFTKTKLNYSPGLIKIIREVIDNSIDEAIRTNMKFANSIDISVKSEFDGDWITIKDNGRGIPIIETEGDEADGSMMPEDAWCTLDAGANFDDEDDNTTMGQNGEGVSLTNIFSTQFIGSTWDGKQSFVLTAKDNMADYDFKIAKSKKKGTEVKFLPDYQRFKINDFNRDHQLVLMTDLINLSLTYPDIKFTYNKKLVKVRNFKEYAKLFGVESFEVSETKNLNIAIMPNNEDTFEFVHYINGLNVYNGGKPLDWVMRNITQGIFDKISKKYPNIKTGDIKNKLFAVAIFQGMVNPRFEDQIKSLCSNTVLEFRPQIEEPDWNKFCNKLIKNKEIIEPITDVYRLKEELQKKKELQQLEKKTKKKVKSEKYLPPTGIKKYLMITEGASATGGLLPVLGRREIGYYELKGKPLNTIKADHKDFMKNVELRELYEIVNSEGYQYIVFATDQDLDGIHIRGLGTAFGLTHLTEHLQNGKIGMLQTPLIGIKKNNKLVDWVYNMNDLTPAIEKKGVAKYYKGLGSWKESDLKQVVAKDGMMKMIDIFEYDDQAEEMIRGWFDPDNVPFRKERIKANQFSLIKL